MRAVVQRVSFADIVVEGKQIAHIEKGIMVLIGFKEEDSDKEILYVIDKILNLRIFEDLEDKMNLSVLDIQGEILVVPNFTLYGDCRQGRRPSYSNASKPESARALFQAFESSIKERFDKVQFGQFQANMKVKLLNDGPVTLLIDSDKQF